MIFTETKLPGAYTIRLEPAVDKRGFFARGFCQDEFRRHGLNFSIAQFNTSYNTKAGTIRGMHYQVAPHAEAKLIRCAMGVVYDVAIDLRPESPTFRDWAGILLPALGLEMVYVPEGFAHGYLSLTDGAVVYYLVSEPYHPECERTVRWDDPAIGIKWPKVDGGYTLSEKDRSAADI